MMVLPNVVLSAAALWWAAANLALACGGVKHAVRGGAGGRTAAAAGLAALVPAALVIVWAVAQAANEAARLGLRTDWLTAPAGQAVLLGFWTLAPWLTVRAASAA